MAEEDYEFVNEPYIVYDDGMTFIRRCKKCYRFVKAPDTMQCNGSGDYIETKNTVCSKCGPTSLIFVGWF